jgi:hypothetical protein
MKKLLFVIPVFGWLLIGCNVKERNELRAKVDSLSIELNTVQEAAYTLQEVGVSVDLIGFTPCRRASSSSDTSSSAGHDGSCSALVISTTSVDHRTQTHVPTS